MTVKIRKMFDLETLCNELRKTMEIALLMADTSVSGETKEPVITLTRKQAVEIRDALNQIAWGIGTLIDLTEMDG